MDIEQVACASCRVSFEDAQSQRAHYKTDFHRYNLKRKVAELPPISFEDFEARLAASQKKEEVDESRACTACNKKFSSDNAYQQHLRSRKHRDKVGSTGNSTAAVAVSPNRGALGPAGDNATYRDGSTGAIDSNPAAAAAVDPEDLARKAKVLNIDRDDLTGEEQQQLDALLSKATFLTEKQCIFCRWEGKDFEGCLDHVTAKHSFFIPDLEYVTNIQDLYMYLSQKVSVGMVCLWCNKQFQSLEAVRGHMEDKGHWKMLYEDETAEYDDYYDFSSTYPEGAQVPGIEGDPQDPGTRELILPPGASRQYVFPPSSILHLSIYVYTLSLPLHAHGISPSHCSRCSLDLWGLVIVVTTWYCPMAP
eukprot:TRINITY_DN1700_c0_g1_i4.p1 TRINITY_DN1700_c0_g1~~TRINITY_DN1700_c0_g1_i4.p1  ORF type:complete len:363 (-),score=67.35 TRINITY_DN1700_c0_g1_i4:350-1438(-)